MLGSTAVLLTITFSSKLIGFVRELILLGSLGIGANLDMFVVLYGLVNLLAGALGICIVTSLTPIAGEYTTRSDTIGLLREGARAGVVAGLIALAGSAFYAAATGAFSASFSGVSDTWPIVLIVPLVVPFAIVAEYQVALFLSRDQRVPVIAGNLILSLPLVAALLLFDLGIAAYAAGLAATFLLRAAIFTALLLRGAVPDAGRVRRAKTMLFSKRLFPTLAGGSAMLAIAAIAVSAQMAARELADGQATIVAYGLKVPQFIITSIWFVLGTGFFADLAMRGTAGANRRIAIYCAINLALALILAVGVLGAPYVLVPSLTWANWSDQSDIALVIAASAPFLPLIVLTPLAEMTQRLLAADGCHRMVLSIAGAILIGGFCAQAIALFLRSMPLIAWSPTLGGALGAGVCAALLLHHPLGQARPTPGTQRTLSHAQT